MAKITETPKSFDAAAIAIYNCLMAKKKEDGWEVIEKVKKQIGNLAIAFAIATGVMVGVPQIAKAEMSELTFKEFCVTKKGSTTIIRSNDGTCEANLDQIFVMSATSLGYTQEQADEIAARLIVEFMRKGPELAEKNEFEVRGKTVINDNYKTDEFGNLTGESFSQDELTELGPTGASHIGARSESNDGGHSKLTEEVIVHIATKEQYEEEIAGIEARRVSKQDAMGIDK